MIDILDITPGESYACRFKVETMLDTLGRPAPNLSDTPLAGVKVYESFGFLKQRDTDKRLVIVVDESSNKEFVVSFDDIWDIDSVEFEDAE